MEGDVEVVFAGAICIHGVGGFENEAAWTTSFGCFGVNGEWDLVYVGLLVSVSVVVVQI